ncbi:hypothetical protein SLA2020_119630 [Shorea laevis]
MLSRRIENAVNAAVRAKTPVPVLFISNHMRKAIPSVITKIKGRSILDGRGIPTIEVDLYTNKGMFPASVPSGNGTGMYEAVDLRDGDKGSYLGNSVTKAIKNINEKISEALIGMDPTLQSQIDQAMTDLDKTEKKSELGANAILAVSIAACKAGAAEKEVPLYKHIADLYGKSNLTIPVPVFSVISGGKHAGNSLAFQALITERYGASGCNVGEVGGLAPNISSVREGLDLVKEAISRTGFNDRIKIAIDVAATEFCIGTRYDLEFKSPSRSGQNFKSGEDMIQMYKELCSDYSVVLIEDPFDKEDWEHNKFFCALGLCQVVGDDLLNSNLKRIEKAIQESACNSLILKINQVGTVTEAIEIKAGAPCRGERLAKYNRLLRIEVSLGTKQFYAGEDWRPSS